MCNQSVPDILKVISSVQLEEDTQSVPVFDAMMFARRSQNIWCGPVLTKYSSVVKSAISFRRARNLGWPNLEYFKMRLDHLLEEGLAFFMHYTFFLKSCGSTTMSQNQEKDWKWNSAGPMGDNGTAIRVLMRNSSSI